MEEGVGTAQAAADTGGQAGLPGGPGSQPASGGSDPIGAAYRHFRGQLVKADGPEDPLDIERIEDAVIRGLSVVSVTSQPGDNAYRIFESLNNTGLPLKQGDLLRNYLFSRLPTRGDVVYSALWLPLQQELGPADLEVLFWLDLVRSDARAKQTDVYIGQQSRLEALQTEAEIEAEIKRFARLGELLSRVLDPAREQDPDVRLRLARLRDWGTTTVYALLLHLLDLREAGVADSAQVAKAMLYIESFLVRRLLIGRATANINRILLSVVTEMRTDLPVEEAVHRYLSTGRKYYATDADVGQAVRSGPYYLNGRPNQRALVLRWLEESYGSKEPVDLTTLTIEHVLPQTPGASWLDVMRQDCDEDEDPEDLHESLVHTLGNLTLTGYNSALSNSTFDTKKVKLATSGISMNQEIAQETRWGRAQIQARADKLAARIASVWPAPTEGDGRGGGPAWDLLEAALAALPAGRWTSYKDLAALIGSHQVPVGQRLATHPAVNAHRVLKGAGVVSPQFRWLEPDRQDDPRDLLRAEGLVFDEQGRADPTQRLHPEDLARLVGLDPELVRPEAADLDDGDNPAGRDAFVQQLHDRQDPEVARAVLRVLDAWTALGGRLSWGTAEEVSAFLVADDRLFAEGAIWPAALYPSGKFEVVFQYLKIRPPFDALELREELRARFNAMPGVDLPADKLEKRPGFLVELLADPGVEDQLLDVLSWFIKRVQSARR